MSYAKSSEWASGYMLDVRHKLGELSIRIATAEEDMKQATDLIVMSLPNGDRIGCRMRTHYYLGRWPDDFTIRSFLDSGATTELHKIMDGWGDYLFYGFAAPGDNDGVVVAARLIDLAVFRVCEPWLPYKDVPNPDGTRGRAYCIRDAPAEIVFHEWGHAPAERQLTLLGLL